MIAALLADAEALRTVAPLVIAAAMVYAFFALTAAVVRTSTRRHARFWSPPRPTRLLAVGRHSQAHHRREYATTHAKHTTARTA